MGKVEPVIILDLARMPMAEPFEDAVRSIQYDEKRRNKADEEKDIKINRCPVYAKGIIRQWAQVPGFRLKRESDVTRYVGLAALRIFEDPWIREALEAINRKNQEFRRPSSAMDLYKSLISGFLFLNEEDPDGRTTFPLHFVAPNEVVEKINYVKAVTGMDEKDIAIVFIYAVGATTRLLEVEMRRVAVREWVNFVVYLRKRAGALDEKVTNRTWVDFACERFELLNL